ncbi:hypothetical protein J2S43_002889 [Catenuloplanes nepalensis]|uniref:Secreted protein n=1 Tax=Catenuloplanes nepalensis TaxID=587533 RepID=A0ABT9MSG2_9ACTN|nr:hypothetical protein [Catenuloplanes nepalensis]MDP9794377.1 hypothetical protein [Catenuloplanes nepalensis]
MPGVPLIPPVWLLDVDGVINAKKPGWGGPPLRRDVYSPGDDYTYPLRFAPALIVRLRELIEAERVEVRWCTTWCPEAHLLERAWSLPPLAVALTQRPLPRGAECWPLKYRAARDVLDVEGRRLIWTDDEALPRPGPDRDALTAGGRALLIAPDSRRGLQPADLDAIDRFTAEAG